MTRSINFALIGRAPAFPVAHSRGFRASVAALLISAVALCSPAAFANSTPTVNVLGKANGTGCSSCHGTPTDATINVAITGSATLVAGATGSYTVTATKSGIANSTKLGVDIRVSDGALSVNAGQSTALTSNEITHSVGVGTLATTTSNSASYSFSYTMPANAPGGSTHTIFSVAALGFTGWNHGTNFTITVPPPAPVVTSGSTASGTVGQAFSYQIAASNTPTSYAVTGTLPTNVTINTGNGLISGTPSNSGSFNVNVTASNAGGTSAPQAVAITIAPVSPAATRYVNAATGSNTSNTCAVLGSPCKTITYAMSQAVAGNPGDLISVAPGTYNLALGEVFPITFKSGVQLVATGTPANTIIDAVGDTVKQAVIRSTSNASAFARIEGFTIRNGRGTTTQGGSATGGALVVNFSASSLFTITRNIFTGNQVTGYTADLTLGETGGLGWGGAIYGFSSMIEISNNIFTSNVAQGGDGYSSFTGSVTNKNAGPGNGGAVYISGSGKIVNNTFYDNYAQGGGGGFGGNGSRGFGGDAVGGAVVSFPGITVSNNIFSTNHAFGGSGGTAGTPSASALSASGTVTNNLFFGNNTSGAAGGSADTTGTSALTSDPKFTLVPTNLQITSVSPAKAAGTATGAPIKDFAGTTRPSPPAIGAYEPAAAVPSTSKLNPIYYLLDD